VKRFEAEVLAELNEANIRFAKIGPDSTATDSPKLTVASFPSGPAMRLTSVAPSARL